MPLGSLLGAVGGLGGGIAVLAGAGGKGGRESYREAVNVWRKLQEPDFDFRELSFPELLVVAEQFPQVYEAVVPDEVRTALDSPELREAQMRGLARLEQTATEGFTNADRVAGQEIGRNVAREGTRLRDAAINQMLQRGGSGGDMIQAQIAGNQAAMESARGYGSDLFRYGADRRMGATQAAAGLAGQVRGQDFGQRQAAVDAINRFNQYVAQSRTQAQADAAGSRERAQSWNTQNRQGLANQSALGRYGAELSNLNRKNALEQGLFDARYAKTAGLSGALFGKGQMYDLAKARKEEQIIGLGESAGGTAGGLLQAGGVGF